MIRTDKPRGTAIARGLHLSTDRKDHRTRRVGAGPETQTRRTGAYPSPVPVALSDLVRHTVSAVVAARCVCGDVECGVVVVSFGADGAVESVGMCDRHHRVVVCAISQHAISAVLIVVGSVQAATTHISLADAIAESLAPVAIVVSATIYMPTLRSGRWMELSAQGTLDGILPPASRHAPCRHRAYSRVGKPTQESVGTHLPPGVRCTELASGESWAYSPGDIDGSAAPDSIVARWRIIRAGDAS